jgi:hypothetical protein
MSSLKEDGDYISEFLQQDRDFAQFFLCGAISYDDRSHNFTIQEKMNYLGFWKEAVKFGFNFKYNFNFKRFLYAPEYSSFFLTQTQDHDRLYAYLGAGFMHSDLLKSLMLLNGSIEGRPLEIYREDCVNQRLHKVFINFS